MLFPCGRNRLAYTFIAGGVIVLGLASRHYAAYLPAFLRKDTGDALYTVFIFVLFGFLRPRASTFHNASLALLFSVLVEFSQIYHAPWIDTIRRVPLGHLILGSGFAWHDMGCYVVGALLGAGCEGLYFCSVKESNRASL